MDINRISYDDFLDKIKEFIAISTKLNDEWKLGNNNTHHGIYIRKECFKELANNILIKAEYIVSYNLSYGVPSFSFNYWNSTGVLLTLNEVKKMSQIEFREEEYYSVVTQQEHPILFRPFFTIHPCHTGSLLVENKYRTKNLIITFLSTIAPIIQLDLPLAYAM